MPRNNPPRKRPDHERRPLPTIYVKGKRIRPAEAQEDRGNRNGF